MHEERTLKGNEVVASLAIARNNRSTTCSVSAFFILVHCFFQLSSRRQAGAIFLFMRIFKDHILMFWSVIFISMRHVGKLLVEFENKSTLKLGKDDPSFLGIVQPFRMAFVESFGEGLVVKPHQVPWIQTKARSFKRLRGHNYVHLESQYVELQERYKSFWYSGRLHFGPK
ncbi:unnamed protein product [Prunus brigantina]